MPEPGAPDEAVEPAEPAEPADASEVDDLVERFQKLLANRRPGPGPVTGRWSLGVGDLIAEHPRVPERVRGLVRRIDLVGLAYSPEQIGFDGTDVPWGKVTEVRTRHVVDYLIADAVEQQVDNLPLPWFPGRGRLLDALGRAVLTVTIATAKDQLERYELDARVPAELAYQGSFGRRKELGAGVLAALVLADPAVNASVQATARANGVPVVESGDEVMVDATERAAALRRKVAALEAVLDRFGRRA